MMWARRCGGILRRAVVVGVAVCVISGPTAIVMDVGPAAADPYSDSQVGLGYASSALGTGAFLLNSIGGAAADLTPFGLGLSLLAGILGPLFGIGSNQPSIQDVLNKLDKITDQLNQIQTQLNQISASITALQQQVAEVSKQVANASCDQLQSQLGIYVNTIDGINQLYASTVTTAQTLSSSQNPKATVATLQEDFTELATRALGTDAITPAGGPLDKAISGIHNLLMGQGGQPTDGVIVVCGGAGLKRYQAETTLGTPSSQQWVDDRPYYAYVTSLVNYYENYEVLALNLIQETSYYRATQILKQNNVAIPADQKTGACAVKQEPSDASQLCRDALGLTKDVYQHLVDEWTLTGRPYSDGKAVLQVDAVASGAGNAKPILWVRDPTAASPCATTGTWGTDPKWTCTFDELDGWKPASLADWQSLQATALSAFANNPCPLGVTAHDDGIFTCMKTVGGFRNVSGIFWIPQQTASGLKLPAPTQDQLSVLGLFMNRYGFEYGGPDLTLRCLVIADPADYFYGGPIGCNQNWLTQHFSFVKLLAESEHSFAATYTVQWGLSNLQNVPPTTFGYYYIEPYNQTGDYAFDDKTGLYPLRINTKVIGSFPFFLEKLQYDDLSVCDNGAEYMCDDNGGVTYTPEQVKEQLWQTLAVPTTNTATQRCVNNVGVPQLCAPVGGTKPTSADQRFEDWLNNTIPNPSEPFPTATAVPSIKESGGDVQCLPAKWNAPPKDWAHGQVNPLPTSWTATHGSSTYTTPINPAIPVRLDNKVNLTHFAQETGFDTKLPFQITCTVSARWEHLANTGFSTSANYQVTPTIGPYFGLTQIPDAPKIGSATAGAGSATLHWTVGASKGGPISSFTITPYISDVAQPGTTIPASGDKVSPSEGAKDSTVIRGLNPGKKYTFRVRANVAVAETTTLVSSPRSSASEVVTPKAPPALSPLSPTTTTVPVGPLSPTTTTVPVSPLSPTTTVPVSPVSTTTIPSGGGFTQSMTKQSTKSALAVFAPRSPIKLVDLHYIVDGQPQQDFRMVLQSDGRYEEPVVNLSSGEKISYWFYYEPAASGSSPITTQSFEYTQP